MSISIERLESIYSTLCEAEKLIKETCDERDALQARIEELEAHVKVTSRAGFIAGVVWFTTESGNKSLNTAADEFAEVDKQIQASASATGFLAGCRYARSNPENWLELRDEIKAEQYAAGLL